MSSSDANRLRAGWDHTAAPQTPPPHTRDRAQPLSLRAQVLSLLADPRVDAITPESASRSLDRPLQDVENAMDAMVQAGELRRDETEEGRTGSPAYRVSAQEKLQLERMFREAAQELGEQGVLMRVTTDESPVLFEDETEEPRLPVTAGLLSLFLPGTGQLLNGDVGRASLVFAVWSLAWITHLSPVWTFVCLYAGAEAFFTAKIRSMERKMAKDALTAAGATPQLPPNPSAP